MGIVKRVLKQYGKLHSGFRFATMLLYSKITGKRIPVAVSLHVNSRCNLRCGYCYANVEDRFDANLSDFTTDEIKRLIDEIYAMGTRWLVLLGGEPLLREDIGELVDYAKKKGILCEIVTNGTLLADRIRDIENVDFICISIDGDEKANDLARGKGTYKRIIRGIEAASRYGIPCRLHAVLSKYNQNCFDALTRLCRKYAMTYGFSQAIVNDYNKGRDFNISEEDTLLFWKKVYDHKKAGHPIYNSLYVLNKLIRWPLPYSRIIKEDREWPQAADFDPIPCFMGKRYAYIDSEGYVYSCVCHGVKNGKNLREVGFRQAWAHLSGNSCRYCSYIEYLETNNYLNLTMGSIWEAIKYFRK
jgi:MoaA/NifB/PqqE/SkfB family radical SAM enzyme